MAKLTLRKRSAAGQRAHVVSRWTRSNDGTGRKVYAVRSDNVLLVNSYWRSSYDDSPQSSGWKVAKRGIDRDSIEARLVALGFTRED